MAAHHHRLSIGGSSSSLSSPPPSSASDSELSELSATPSPPSSPFLDRVRPYISPSSSKRSSAKNSPAPVNMRPTPPNSDYDGPARKRRKLGEPKERTTQRLDLTQDNVENDPQLKRVLDVLHKKRKIVVVAGAGISVSAGIPDFRSSTGLFSSLRTQHKLKSSGKDLFDASVYREDSSTSSFHDMVRELSKKTKDAEPTSFHHLLATLANEGRLLRLYTQNVDGIDTSLPPLKTEVPLPKKGPWPKTVQLHGGLDHMVCSKCHTLSDFDADQFNGPVPPACPDCTEKDQVRQAAEKRTHGIGRLRPRMVLYNEHNPDDEAIGACAGLDLRTRPDAIIVVGTSLKVPGVRRIVREMCAVVRDRRDGVAIWINNDPVPVGKDLANSWDIVVQGPCDEVARHAAMPRWNDPTTYKEVTDDEVNQTKEKQRPRVLVPMSTPKKSAAFAQMQMLTPAASPQPQHIPPQQDQPTPSKRGRKRKSDTQPDVVEKKPKVPAKRAPPKKQPEKRKPAAKKAKAGDQKMTNMFSISKSSASTAVTKEKETQFINAIPNTSLPDVSLPDNTMNPAFALSTPTQPKLTRWKLHSLNPSHSRLNMSPDMEPFTSPPNSPQRTPRPTKTTTDYEAASRRSSASSWKNETIAPDGPIPRNFASLIDT